MNNQSGYESENESRNASEGESGMAAEAGGRHFDPRSYGATGGGRTKDTEALNRAIADCHVRGGGTVRLTAGTYLTGTVFLRSQVTLELEAGATLLGSPDLDDYAELPYTSEFRNRVLLVAFEADGVAVTGRGTIDGNSDAYVLPGRADLSRDFVDEYTRQGAGYNAVNDEPDDGPLEMKPRPGILLLFLKCTDVHVSHIRIRNAPNWCLHVARSDGVLLTGLDIRNSLLVPNADGIDVSRSRNVRISDCNIEGGDDGLAFSPCAEGYGDGGSENVVVQNCTIISRSAGIRLGWDAFSFRNFLFHNIVIHGSNRGIGLYLREGESIDNVIFSNIVIETRLHKGKWWGKAEPIHISVVPLPAYTKESGFTGTMGRMRNIVFRDIIANGEQGIVVTGKADSYLENVTFENIRLSLKEGPLQQSFGGNFDFRPSRDPALNVFAHDIPALYAAYVRNLTLRNVDVEWEGSPPDYAVNALEIERFDGVLIDGFSGRQPHLPPEAQPHGQEQPQKPPALPYGAAAWTADGGAAIWLRDGRGVTVRNSRAKPGTDIFVRLERVDEAGLFALNDIAEAERPIVPDDHGFTVASNLDRPGR